MFSLKNSQKMRVGYRISFKKVIFGGDFFSKTFAFSGGKLYFLHKKCINQVGEFTKLKFAEVL